MQWSCYNSSSGGRLLVSATAVVCRQEERAAASSGAAAVQPLLLQVDTVAELNTATLKGAARAPVFDSIESALEAIRRGQPVVVLDDEDRENEGDLIMAAEKVAHSLLCPLIYDIVALHAPSVCCTFSIMGKVPSAWKESQHVQLSCSVTGTTSACKGPSVD